MRYEVKPNERENRNVFKWRVWDSLKRRTVVITTEEAAARSTAQRLNAEKSTEGR